MTLRDKAGMRRRITSRLEPSPRRAGSSTAATAAGPGGQPGAVSEGEVSEQSAPGGRGPSVERAWIPGRPDDVSPGCAPPEPGDGGRDAELQAPGLSSRNKSPNFFLQCCCED